MNAHCLLRTPSKTIDFFRSNNGYGSILAYTFSPLGHYNREGTGWGGDFLLSIGVDVVAIKSSQGDWYQTLSPDDLVGIADAVDARRYQRRIGYGSSMGGYGAFAFAHHLHMTDALTFSPQIHIGLDFDKRWSGRLKFFEWQHSLKASPDCRYVAVYDPKNLDAGHVDRYASVLPRLERIKLPGSGHSSVEKIAMDDLLKSFVTAFFLDGIVLDVGQNRD